MFLAAMFSVGIAGMTTKNTFWMYLIVQSITFVCVTVAKLVNDPEYL